jgi:ubiquinone/menaquinone biosynthesis C-methylase UbiE
MKTISSSKSDSQTDPGNSGAQEILREWRESAFYWQKHFGVIRTMFQPLTLELIYSAVIVEGQSVLDIACGSGEPSLTIAETVGPTGSVTCTDVVAEMVAAAEIEAQRRGLSNLKFRQCPADALPFESKSFDVVVCRLGVMFFPDPLAALREMLRVTKAGGAISLAVWGKSELNPFFYDFNNVVAPRFDLPPSDPNAPGAFRFAEPDSLARILKQAGATNVNERELKFHIAAPLSPKIFWEVRSETSATLRELVATLSAQERALVAEEVQDAIREFFPNDEMSFPAQMMLVTGRKS